MNKTLWISLVFVATFFVNTATLAEVTYKKSLNLENTQLFIEKAVIDWNYECFFICDGVKIPVKLKSDGYYHTAGGTKIPDIKVTCIGKATDKIATANSTANRAEGKADRANKRLDNLDDHQEAFIDSLDDLRGDLTFIWEQYNELNTLVLEQSEEDKKLHEKLKKDLEKKLDDGIERLVQDMPPDQSGAIALLRSQISGLEDNDKIFKAFALKKGKSVYQTIELKAAEVKAAELKALEDPEDADPPSPDPKPRRKWWQRR